MKDYGVAKCEDARKLEAQKVKARKFNGQEFYENKVDMLLPFFLVRDNTNHTM